MKARGPGSFRVETPRRRSDVETALLAIAFLAGLVALVVFVSPPPT